MVNSTVYEIETAHKNSNAVKYGIFLLSHYHMLFLSW